MKLKLVFFLSIILSVSVALELNIDSKEQRCFFLTPRGGQTLLIKYDVVGYKPEEFQMDIFSVSSVKEELVFTEKNKKESFYELAANGGEYKVCFQSLDNAGKILQFEFEPLENTITAYANDKTLQWTLLHAQQAYYTLNDIYSNFRHSLMKSEMQQNILDSTEYKLKWCSIIKMLLMISLTTIQVLFLTGLLKDYNPIGV